MINPKSEIRNPKIKVGIIGAGGYAGLMLLQILLRHPEVEISYLMSEEAHVGKKISELYPHLLGECDLVVGKTAVKKADVVFLALPHGLSQELIPDILKLGAKVIDLGSDYRFAKEAVYGLSELYRAEIKKTQLVANPGCYPTASILALAPLAKAGLVDLSAVIVDAKSGTSGAGRGLSLKTLFCERNEGIEGYNVVAHRHMGEIEEQVIRISGNQGTRVTFVPHLVPMTRGILATVYAKCLMPDAECRIKELYREFYKNEHFVRVRESQLPNTKYVAGTNYCDLSVQVNAGTGQVIVLSAIDNLVKGAAGQAVQNMNIMFGLKETIGLAQIAIYP